MAPIDTFGRALGSLRISVTDRCNLRCNYCMPEDDYVWLPRKSILTFEETARLACLFAGLGVRKLRLTGGEPLLRTDLPDLVRLLAATPDLDDLAMTTNAVLLARHAEALRDAGLRRVTVSLDTLKPERYREMTRADRLPEALAGIDAARGAEFGDLKLNAVVVRGVNDDEIADLLDYGARVGAEVRFIEYMDVGGATRWTTRLVVTRDEILTRVAERFGPVREVERRDPAAPADRYRLDDGTVFGVIASTSQPFCGGCDRSRLTADGLWYLCLYAAEGIDLKTMLREGATDEVLAELVTAEWQRRTDRGAEARVTIRERAALYAIEGLRADPHKEMHTRGG